MKRMIFLAILALAASCEEDLRDVEALGENEAIIGTWVEDGYDQDMTLLERAAGLDPSSYGFIIGEDGSFTERKNAGWCGTPPIAYDNFEGSWEALSDSLLEITVGYWGGTLTYQMRVVFLDGDRLGIRYLYADERLDAK